jgi:hypothetical protein
MSLPFVLHGVFTAVEGTLAGSLECEVRRMGQILATFS